MTSRRAGRSPPRSFPRRARARSSPWTVRRDPRAPRGQPRRGSRLRRHPSPRDAAGRPSPWALQRVSGTSPPLCRFASPASRPRSQPQQNRYLIPVRANRSFPRKPTYRRAPGIKLSPCAQGQGTAQRQAPWGRYPEMSGAGASSPLRRLLAGSVSTRRCLVDMGRCPVCTRCERCHPAEETDPHGQISKGRVKFGG